MHPSMPFGIPATDRAEPLLTMHSMKPEMWANLAKELGMPWRTAEAMHWHLGEHNMANRASVKPFVMAATSGTSRSDIGGGACGDPTSPRGGGRGGGLEGSSGRSSDGDERGDERRRRRCEETVLPRVRELDARVGPYEQYDDEYDDESDGRSG